MRLFKITMLYLVAFIYRLKIRYFMQLKIKVVIVMIQNLTSIMFIQQEIV